MSSILVGHVLELEHLSQSEKLILLALADAANRQGSSWPGMKTIAIAACCTERHARRTIRNLETKGYVTSLRRFRPNKSKTSNEYQLNLGQLGAIRHSEEGPDMRSGGGDMRSDATGHEVRSRTGHEVRSKNCKDEKKGQRPIDPNEFAEYRRTAPPQMTYQVWIKRKKAKIPMRDPL